MKKDVNYQTPVCMQMVVESQGVLAASPVFGNETPGVDNGIYYRPGEGEEWFN